MKVTTEPVKEAALAARAKRLDEEAKQKGEG